MESQHLGYLFRPNGVKSVAHTAGRQLPCSITFAARISVMPSMKWDLARYAGNRAAHSVLALAMGYDGPFLFILLGREVQVNRGGALCFPICGSGGVQPSPSYEERHVVQTESLVVSCGASTLPWSETKEECHTHHVRDGFQSCRPL